MRVRSGEGNIGDFSAIIVQGHSTRSWKAQALSRFNHFSRYLSRRALVMYGESG